MNAYAIIVLSVISVINYMYFVSGRRLNDNEKKYMQIFFVFFFSIVMAFKADYVKDAAEYAKVFQNAGIWLKKMTSFNITQKYNSYEVGWIFVNYFFAKVCNNLCVFNFCISLFNTIITPKYLAKLVNRDEDEDLFRVIYISWHGILYAGIAVRAGVMISISLIALYYAYQRSYLKSILFFGFAFLIQRSCFIFIFLLLVSKVICFNDTEKINRRMLQVTACLFILLPLNIGKITSNMMDSFLAKILKSLGLGNYYVSYVGERTVGGELGSAKTLLLSACVVVCFLAVRIKVDYISYAYVAILAATIILVFFAGMRAASRAYDMGYLFLIPICSDALHYSEQTEDAISYLGFGYTYLIMIIISINTCFIH